MPGKACHVFRNIVCCRGEQRSDMNCVTIMRRRIIMMKWDAGEGGCSMWTPLVHLWRPTSTTVLQLAPINSSWDAE